MKFSIWAFLLFSTSLLLPGQAVFKGQVVFADGASVAEGWQVLLTTSPTIQEFRTKTDANGRFVLENLPSGLATLRITDEGGQYAKTIHELWINNFLFLYHYLY